MTNLESKQENDVTKDPPPPYVSSVTAPASTYAAGQQVHQPPSYQESNVQSPSSPFVQNPSHGITAPQQPTSYRREPSMNYAAHNTFPTQSITEVHVVRQLPIDSPNPTNVYCPYCNSYVTTRVAEVPGSATYCFTVVLCCLFWPLAWLPFFMSGCLDKVHQCPNCNNILGTFRA